MSDSVKGVVMLRIEVLLYGMALSETYIMTENSVLYVCDSVLVITRHFAVI